MPRLVSSPCTGFRINLECHPCTELYHHGLPFGVPASQNPGYYLLFAVGSRSLSDRNEILAAALIDTGKPGPKRRSGAAAADKQPAAARRVGLEGKGVNGGDLLDGGY